MKEEMLMDVLLNKPEYQYIGELNRDVIIRFNNEMEKLGYTCNNTIVPGFCWGNHMIIYTKANVKSKKSYARIYLKDNELIVRMYFSDVNSKKEVIEESPEYIKDAFTGEYGYCKFCHNMKDDGSCSHRKSYQIDNKDYHFCDGYAFWFFNPTIDKIPEYIKLFMTFYPQKKEIETL